MFVRLLKLDPEVRSKYDVVVAVRHPRRCAVPDPGEEADDRMVRTGAARVLRGNRGQRLHVLQQ